MNKLRAFFSSSRRTTAFIMTLTVVAIVVVLAVYLRPAATHQPDPTPSLPGITSSQAPAVSQAQLEAAKQTALADTGLSAEDVTFTKAQQEYDDGALTYEVEFVTDTTEYEYKISSAGSVLERSTETLAGAAKPQTQTTPAPSAGSEIGLEAAKQAALADAGLSAGDVTFTQAKQDLERGAVVYELEFVTATTEYDYEISATGAVLEKSSETLPSGARPETAPAQSAPPATAPTQSAPPAAAEDIGLEAAKQAALADAGLSAGDVTFTKAKQDLERGSVVYEVEFVTASAEYEYEISAAGAILDKSVETFRAPAALAPTAAPAEPTPAPAPETTAIGLEAAKQTALADASLSVGDVTFTKAKQDLERGSVVYELEFVTASTEYEYEISAAGAVLERSSEPRDWD